MYEYPDEELINLMNDGSEEAGDILYDKYSFIVDLIYNRYKRSAYALSVDLKELKQEALLGFSNALASFNPSKAASLSTYISICVERRVANYIRHADTTKSKLMKEAYSLDSQFDEEEKLSLLDVIGDYKNDPGINLEQQEQMREIQKKVDELLSPTEKEVYELMLNDFNYSDIAAILNKTPKQIDNTIQRIRNKLREII